MHCHIDCTYSVAERLPYSTGSILSVLADSEDCKFIQSYVQQLVIIQNKGVFYCTLCARYRIKKKSTPFHKEIDRNLNLNLIL